VKKLLFGVMLLSVFALYAQQAVAQKESHKDYASMKIDECNSCHKSEGVALNHDADWLRGHRLVAQKGGANCNQCHEQSFCLDCHSGGGIDVKLSTQNYKKDYIPKSHRSDFLEIHPIKALDNPQTCTRCHDQKYCIQCHSKFKPNNLQFQSHRTQFSNINLTNVGPNHANFTPAQCQTCHPNGQLPAHMWSADHAVEARRNLQACQSCHSDGDVCMKCHSALQNSGLRINPHPRNWDSIKNNLKNKSNGRTCIKCHAAGTF
jgi:hypothetical protein